MLLVWTTPDEEHEESLKVDEVTSEALAAILFKTKVAEGEANIYRAIISDGAPKVPGRYRGPKSLTKKEK